MTDIVTHLREWGLHVQLKPGYRDRGRPYSFKPRAVICHHTASGSLSGNFASESIVTTGRSDLPGPLCQFLLGRDGTVKVIALGYANHAGEGGPRAGIPANLGNSYAYGIEAENNGVGERWSAEQLNAYYRLCAALLDWMNISDVSRVFGHKEWTSRKIDPAGIDMNGFRANVRKALEAGPSVTEVSLKRLKPGNKNVDIRRVKYRLKQRGFYEGAVTKHWNKRLEYAYAAYQKSLGYKGKNADGIPGRESLEKLGFKVNP